MLGDYMWPVTEIVGSTPGPRVCVMAGIHVNESSGMKAALTLVERLSPESLRGVVSVLPMVNQPADYKPTVVIPTDGKNIHWLFPGDTQGTFSDVLAHALLSEWAKDADVLIDLHGGDFGQDLTTYVVYQRSGNADLDSRAEAVARCFPAPIIVALDPAIMEKTGRCCTALARQGKVAIVSEAGVCGMLDPQHVQFHMEGILAVLGHLNMIPAGPVAKTVPHPITIDHYVFVDSPESGFAFPARRAGEVIRKGEEFVRLRNVFNEHVASIVAPFDGVVMWCTSQIMARKGSRLGALGRIATD